jgi:glycosyltransferase involved in cell wall biosynthesis
MISVIINTFNEEKNIEECILSARLLTDDILVVDMESTDATVELARKMGAQVISHPFMQYVEPAREHGIKLAKYDWVFILDTDERIIKELAKEVKQQIASAEFSYYKVPRKNIFGRDVWVKHGGWWPDHQTRLINKKFLKSWPKAIHSVPVIEGKLGFLNEPFLHYFQGNFEKMVEKTINYENIESDLLFKADRPVSTITFFRKFVAELYRRLIKHVGFLDGDVGIMVSIYQAFSKTVTYLYLYEKKKSRSL